MVSYRAILSTRENNDNLYRRKSYGVSYREPRPDIGLTISVHVYSAHDV
jgi:hypothetical protein